MLHKDGLKERKPLTHPISGCWKVPQLPEKVYALIEALRHGHSPSNGGGTARMQF